MQPFQNFNFLVSDVNPLLFKKFNLLKTVILFVYNILIWLRCTFEIVHASLVRLKNNLKHDISEEDNTSW